MELRGVEPVLSPARQAGRTEDVTDEFPVDEICRFRGENLLINKVMTGGQPFEKYMGKAESLFDLVA